MGSFSTTWLKDPTMTRKDSKLEAMLKERTRERFYYYALAADHKHFPEQRLIFCGGERRGTLIARKCLNKEHGRNIFSLLSR